MHSAHHVAAMLLGQETLAAEWDLVVLTEQQQGFQVVPAGGISGDAPPSLEVAPLGHPGPLGHAGGCSWAKVGLFPMWSTARPGQEQNGRVLVRQRVPLSAHSQASEQVMAWSPRWRTPSEGDTG